MTDRLLVLVILLVVLAVYLIAPAVIALARQHPERKLIYKLSPLTFFSFILWFVLMAWAFTGHRDDAVISRYVARLRANNRLPWVIAALVSIGLCTSLLALMR